MNHHLRRNPAVTAVTAELEARGIDYRIEINRHVKVRWADGLCVVSASPSDRRAAVSARATVRRMLRKGEHK